MAKKKLDMLANEEYMNNAALIAFTNHAKAIEKRKEYIWTLETKFHSQEIYKSGNLETGVNEEDKCSLRRNDTWNNDNVLTQINSEGKKAVSRPRQNVRERYHKQISASMKSETVRNEKDPQQKMGGKYVDPGKGPEYSKEIPDTKQSFKPVSTTQKIFGENQSFVSKMNVAENAVNDQLHGQMKKDSYSSQISSNYHASKKVSKVSYVEKLPDNPHAAQLDLKRKQRFTFGSAGSIINEYQPRRDLNSVSSAQRIRQHNRQTEKRIRREFEAPENNNLLNPHNFTQDLKQHSSTGKSVTEEFEKATKSVLCLNIWKNEDNHEFIIFLSDLNKVKEKYAKISEVIPEIDAEEKEVKYCFEAVKAVMTFLFEPTYNLDVMPKERTAIEILAASKSWEIHDLRSHFQEQFLGKCLSQENVEELYSLAFHFGENDICGACRNFSKDNALLNLTTNKYGQKSCFIKIETYNEPMVFHIPLVKGIAEDRRGHFKSSLQTEISNEIMFEAISGNYAIKGFEIKLNTDCNNNIKDLPPLEISYDTVNSDENIVLYEQKNKPLRSKIIIYFKKKLIVKANQKAKITVETYIKPCLCSVVKSKKITEKNLKGEFNLSVTSTCKSQWNEERFLVGNLLYNYL